MVFTRRAFQFHSLILLTIWPCIHYDVKLCTAWVVLTRDFSGEDGGWSVLSTGTSMWWCHSLMKEEKMSLILPVHGVVIAFFPLDRSDGYTVKEAPCRNLKSIKWSLRCIDTGIGRPMYTTLHLGNKWDDATKNHNRFTEVRKGDSYHDTVATLIWSYVLRRLFCSLSLFLWR